VRGNKNKSSMETKKEVIIRYIRQYDRGGYSLDEVADDILLLFGVINSVCVHHNECEQRHGTSFICHQKMDCFEDKQTDL